MSTTTSFQRLHVSPLIPSDIPGIVTFNQAAWAHGVGDIFKRDIFQPYSTDSPEARAIYTEYYTHELSNNNPIEHYLKVVDTQIGPGNENGNRIIACGCWAVFKIDPWSEEARDGPEGKAIRQKVDAFWLEGREEWREKKRMAEHVFDFLVYASSQVEGLRRGHLHLHLLFSDPNYHKIGAGSAIMRWGTEQADKLKLPCFLFASEYASGQKFYHNHGFKDIATGRWNHDSKMFPSLPEARATAMYRPVPGEEGDESRGKWMGEPLSRGEDGRMYILA